MSYSITQDNIDSLSRLNYFFARILLVVTTMFIFTMEPFIFVGLVNSAFREKVIIISMGCFAICTNKFTKWQILVIIILFVWFITKVLVNDSSWQTLNLITMLAIYSWSVLLARALHFNIFLRSSFINYYIKLVLCLLPINHNVY